jgi:hypothetical protein
VTRNFGLNARESHSGGEHSPARYGADTHAGSYGLAPQSVLHRQDIRQAALDIGAVIFAVFFACASAVSIGAGLFILLFVNLR